jgi:hypothetical protein
MRAEGNNQYPGIIVTHKISVDTAEFGQTSS